MAKARKLEKRRRSIRNIRKITRTMELISTARFKRAMDRATAATAYTRRIMALVGHLARSGLEVTHPLLEQRFPESLGFRQGCGHPGQVDHQYAFAHLFGRAVSVFYGDSP